MTKGNYKEFLSHPLFLSFVLWFILSLFIPPVFSKYKVHIGDELLMPNKRYYFNDLDSDNQSEKISVDLNDTGGTQIIFSIDENVIDQFNLNHQAEREEDLFFGDYNDDGIMECFVFTRSPDSIFLNVIDPVLTHKILIRNRFIDVWQKADNSTNTPRISPVSMVKSSDGVFSELIFTINTGLSKQPRNVYKYSLEKDSLIKSPESAAVINSCSLFDLDQDGHQEIILGTSATGNFEESANFSDLYTWLMILSDQLKFVFPPVQFKEYPSRLYVIPFTAGKKSNLVLFNDYFGVGGIKSSFYLFDNKGNKVSERIEENYESSYSYILNNPDTSQHTFFFIKNSIGDIEELTDKFEVRTRLKIPEIEEGKPLDILDADGDGKKELIFLGRNSKSIIITQGNFTFPVSISLSGIAGSPVISKINKKDAPPELYFQLKDSGLYVRYFKNPVYFLKYPFYAALYLSLLAFIILISRINQYRINLKLQTEKKIASLQMKAIKNQIDPHFTLNILNAIGSLYSSEEDKTKADYIFGKYAKLIRQTVISSDKIIISLAEEIDFVKNYLDLEKFRLKDLFRYQVDIGNDVGSSVKIPGMLVHTFVENAIKHGIKNRTADGNISISIRKIPGSVQILIEDNGPGLGLNDKSDQGTGKGLVIINEMIELYYRLEHSRISYTIENILTPDNSITGTRARIRIPS